MQPDVLLFSGKEMPFILPVDVPRCVHSRTVFTGNRRRYRTSSRQSRRGPGLGGASDGSCVPQCSLLPLLRACSHRNGKRFIARNRFDFLKRQLFLFSFASLENWLQTGNSCDMTHWQSSAAACGAQMRP